MGRPAADVGAIVRKVKAKFPAQYDKTLFVARIGPNPYRIHQLSPLMKSHDPELGRQAARYLISEGYGINTMAGLGYIVLGRLPGWNPRSESVHLNPDMEKLVRG